MRSKLIKLSALIVVVLITAGIVIPAQAIDDTTVQKTLNNTAEIILNTVKNPVVDSIGGEWAVLGLARSGYNVPRSYYDNYYKTVEKYVKDKNGVLHDKKYTEYSRVILALTAAGYDPRNVGGYDLTLALGDLEKTIWQGTNGPVFALIALDSAEYNIPTNRNASTQATRELYISEILNRQLPDGGFALGRSEGSADIEITAMALQALSKYKNRTDVQIAIDKALIPLSEFQDNNGGYGTWGEENSECVVQAVVALCELGISIDDARFVKNGNSLLDRLMDYYLPGRGFEHTLGGGMNQMATEQALYALSAIYRHNNGLKSLYDMTDTNVKDAPTPDTGNAGLPGKHADIKIMPQTAKDKSFSDITSHKNKSAIEALASRNIIDGMGNGLFSPGSTMTRAQFATIVTRALGLIEDPSAINGKFADIKSDSWYSGFVGTAYKYGIVNGKSESLFAPDGQITKQEAAAMISRAAALCGMDIEMNNIAVRDMLAQFDDYRSVAEYAKAPLAFCYAQNILSQDDMEIKPNQNVTRGEIAEMLFRLLDKAELIR